MNEDYLELIEPTPDITSKKCKIIFMILNYCLEFGAYIIGICIWYLYDYFIAAAGALLGFIVIGIIRSKLRNSAIPPSQREFQYSDKEIAQWYTSKLIC